jgi:hypothetical protein
MIGTSMPSRSHSGVRSMAARIIPRPRGTAPAGVARGSAARDLRSPPALVALQRPPELLHGGVDRPAVDDP